MNSVNFVGRIAKEPEYKVTDSGKSLGKFVLAVKSNHPSKATNEDETSFFNCICWGFNAEFVYKYIGKGRLVSVMGELKNRSWVNQDGTKGYITEVIVENLNALDKKKEVSEVKVPPTENKEAEFVDEHPEIDLATFDPFAEEVEL